MNTSVKKQIAIIGGGPSGLFVFKRLLESRRFDLSIHIFESTDRLGAGMPYSPLGAGREHITNVSGNEIPELEFSLKEWIDSSNSRHLAEGGIEKNTFSDYKVLPRLLFGEYLSTQFSALIESAQTLGVEVQLHLETRVVDISTHLDSDEVSVVMSDGATLDFDHVVISTGHYWPDHHEQISDNYFDSPYPPLKIAKKFDHPIAIKGSSLTAVDAIRTLSRANGAFTRNTSGGLIYEPFADTSNFRIILHSRNGLLPGIRFHLDDPHLWSQSLLTADEIQQHKNENRGFVSLDYIFERDFKTRLLEKDPALFEIIRDLKMEEFVETVMRFRRGRDPFDLFLSDYGEAQTSIKGKESVHWKELLGVLSFAMNYPAKHFSAEDMLRLQDVLMPLISVVIAFVPQSSAEEMLALHKAGVLEIIAVANDSEVAVAENGEIIYRYGENISDRIFKTFIDCSGQPHLSIDSFPFRSLVESRIISQARLEFRSSNEAAKLSRSNRKIHKSLSEKYVLEVSGVAINDDFQVVNNLGQSDPRIFLMAVPFIGGFNPDYSGLDFCDEASDRIVKAMLSVA